MSVWILQTIEVRISKNGMKRLQSAQVSQDGLFAYYQTYAECPGFGYTVFHVPSGYALSRGHSNRRNAELFAAIWRSLPLPWNRDVRAIKRASLKMPAQLLAWMKEVRA